MSKDTKFKPGESGNPLGRPKGSKNRLSEDFLFELSKVFQEKGREAIERMADEHPADFVRCVAGLVPKELLFQISTEETTRWVINAKPMTTLEWMQENGLDVNESPLMLENDQ